MWSDARSFLKWLTKLYENLGTSVVTAALSLVRRKFYISMPEKKGELHLGFMFPGSNTAVSKLKRFKQSFSLTSVYVCAHL